MTAVVIEALCMYSYQEIRPAFLDTVLQGRYLSNKDMNDMMNIIRDSVVADRHNVALPQRVVDVIKCKNPRCITSVEREIVHEFKLTDPVKKVYRCIYCEQAASK